ncbi:hypothetical protein EUX98_g7672 [Antrodiella citrinella]|uniref:Transcobalamin-like C-terminal domain-containing protein n=1 Tax=Antrodiella citrinella TaxID=2447956 RepID=A0A4S4MKY1_9APHY|nr:hypothetical protein EUX98_g7672 [Antrodiella citrinella]
MSESEDDVLSVLKSTNSILTMQSGFPIFPFLALTSLILTVLGSPVAITANLGTFVNLRVEGATDTIFEGLIFTRGHNVTTVSGGNHHCDGTNNDENPRPGPTCTSALDSASYLAKFTFDGTFDPQFDDFFITSIGDSTQNVTQFWGILLNFQFTPVGGCQQEVQLGDQVLWAFDAFSKAHVLKLAGLATALVGHAAQFSVTDGSTEETIEGASVVASGGAGTQISDTDGVVSFTFSTAGIHDLKASRDDSIRSNIVSILVI